MQKININDKEQKISIDIIANIREEVDKLSELKNKLIDQDNLEEIKDELTKASSIIEEIHSMEYTNVKYFSKLQFVYNSLNLATQKYEIEQEMEILSQVSRQINRDITIVEEKMKDIQKKQKELDDKSVKLEQQTEKAEERNNNLVYNLLGFLTAFSIVSGVVGVVAEIKGIVQVMIFIAFTIFILLTTLIGLHNFYENNNKRETKLQDNYFLWKAALIVLIALVIVLIIKGIHNNKENILNYLDSKIENVIEEKVNNKLREN
nr:MAG TPA: hypothetical protein [Caudoviricetes sp.]